MACKPCLQKRRAVLSRLPAGIAGRVAAPLLEVNEDVARVIDAARSWVGVPFRHQGRDRSGIDCVGLPIVICKDLGVLPAEFDVANYGRLPTGQIIELLQRQCKKLSEPVPGSLVVIAWDKLAAHVAICTGPTIVHSYQSVGRVIEHGYRGRWLRVTHSIWALPGVRYE